MERQSVSFFAMIFILLFAVVGFILVVFDLRGVAFVFMLGLLLAFMFLLAFGMFLAYQNKRKSWGIIGAVLMLMILNVFVIFLLTRRFGISYLVSLVFSAFGLVVSLANVISSREPRAEPAVEDHGKYYNAYSGKEEPLKAVKSEAAATVEKTFTPGKYVASRKANKFHSAKCDWAARISKENRVWFNSREEAQSKGFEADKCVG